ncbi:unnamed protein product, partial [Rotaria sp. Silwood2]
FQVECIRKPVFVLACDQGYFDGLQGAIHTLDTYWSDHRIIFYDLGISSEQETLLRTKCARCTIIKFPFSSIEKYASHIGTLLFFAFKPFVIQVNRLFDKMIDFSHLRNINEKNKCFHL